MADVSVWRVEWWRLVRTRRLLVLVAVYVFLGFTEPLATRYIQQLVNHAGGSGITVIAQPPVPADGIRGYVSNAMLLGLVVSIVVAGYACAVDANQPLAVFYRTRARSFGALLLPRVAATTAAVAGAYLVGLGVAWYETAVLIGAPDAGAMPYVALDGVVYLAFAVAVTALAGTVARGTLATVGLSVAALLLLPLLGELPAVSRWLPSALVGAPDALLAGGAADHAQRALAVAVLLACAALALAAVRGGRREAG